jgi:hypothetical protein
MALPSSHSSPLSIVPLPQTAAGVHEPSHEGPGGGFFAPESVVNKGGVVIPASLEGDGISVGFLPGSLPRTTVASPLQPATIAAALKVTIDRHPKREDLKLTPRAPSLDAFVASPDLFNVSRSTYVAKHLYRGDVSSRATVMTSAVVVFTSSKSSR